MQNRTNIDLEKQSLLPNSSSKEILIKIQPPLNSVSSLLTKQRIKKGLMITGAIALLGVVIGAIAEIVQISIKQEKNKEYDNALSDEFDTEWEQQLTTYNSIVETCRDVFGDLVKFIYKDSLSYNLCYYTPFTNETLNNFIAQDPSLTNATQDCFPIIDGYCTADFKNIYEDQDELIISIIAGITSFLTLAYLFYRMYLFEQRINLGIRTELDFNRLNQIVESSKEVEVEINGGITAYKAKQLLEEKVTTIKTELTEREKNLQSLTTFFTGKYDPNSPIHDFFKALGNVEKPIRNQSNSNQHSFFNIEKKKTDNQILPKLNVPRETKEEYQKRVGYLKSRFEGTFTKFLYNATLHKAPIQKFESNNNNDNTPRSFI